MSPRVATALVAGLGVGGLSGLWAMGHPGWGLVVFGAGLLGALLWGRAPPVVDGAEADVAPALVVAMVMIAGVVWALSAEVADEPSSDATVDEGVLVDAGAPDARPAPDASRPDAAVAAAKWARRAVRWVRFGHPRRAEEALRKNAGEPGADEVERALTAYRNAAVVWRDAQRRMQVRQRVG